MRKALTFTVLMLAVLASDIPAGGHQLPGRVLRVIDGDSLVLDVRGGLYRVDLAGIDAPELNQPWGGAASDRLRQLLTGAFVVVDAQTTRASWLRGTIRFKDRDVGLQLIDAGLAWSLFRDDPATAGLATRPHPYTLAERAARREHRGLWSDEEPIPPWQWRQRSR